MIEIIALLVLLLVFMLLIYRRARIELEDLRFAKMSLSSKYGKMTEQFMPFMKDYPYDSQRFRFIGTPVDGVQFEDDRIVFVEFKSAGGRLSPPQKRIKELVDDKKVEFREVRIG